LNEKNMKLTDLDYATASHHLQMLKAAIPYMEVPQQKKLALFIKWNELKRTMDFFDTNDEGMMSVCSLDAAQTSPVDMLTAVKPYANQKEQEFIDLLSGILAGRSTISNGRSPITMEQILSFLPPEQQARMETLQMFMQTLGQL